MDFSVLGPLEIAGPRGPVEVIAGRPATLLVALLLHAHRPVPIATLTVEIEFAVSSHEKDVTMLPITNDPIS